MSLPPTLLLFDIDGTMLTTGGAGMRAMRIVAEGMFGPSFTFEGIDPGGGLDPWIFAEAVRRNGISDDAGHSPRFRRGYLAELERQLRMHGDAVRIMPGIRDVITHLRVSAANGANHVLGMLTGNFSAAVPLKMAAIDIDPESFTVNAFGDEAPTRPDLVALAMQRYEQRMGRMPSPGRVFVIGDTPRDVQCARAHDCVAFAVATGKFSPAELERAGADHVVDDLSDPSPLLALLNREDARRSR